MSQKPKDPCQKRCLHFCSSGISSKRAKPGASDSSRSDKLIVLGKQSDISEGDYETYDWFWIPTLKGLAREILRRRLCTNPHPDSFEPFPTAHDATVERFGSVNGVYKVVIPRECYCEYTHSRHRSSVFFVVDTKNLTYYQSDDACKIHQLPEGKRRVWCLNPFYGMCNSDKPLTRYDRVPTLLELFETRCIRMQFFAALELFLYYYHETVKLTPLEDHKPEGYYYDEKDCVWKDIREISSYTLTDDFRMFGDALWEAIRIVNGIPPTVENGRKGLRIVSRAKVTKNRLPMLPALDEKKFVRNMDKKNKHLVPLKGGWVWDAFSRQRIVNDKNHMFSRSMNASLLPLTHPAVENMTQTLKDILVDPLAGNEMEQWTYWKQLLGYFISGYNYEYKLYSIEGGPYSGIWYLYNLVSGVVGDFGYIARRKFFFGAEKGAHDYSKNMLKLFNARTVVQATTKEDGKLNSILVKQLVESSLCYLWKRDLQSVRVCIQAKLLFFGEEKLNIGDTERIKSLVAVRKLTNSFVSSPDPNKPRQKPRASLTDPDLITKCEIDAFMTIACEGLADFLAGPAEVPQGGWAEFLDEADYRRRLPPYPQEKSQSTE